MNKPLHSPLDAQNEPDQPMTSLDLAVLMLDDEAAASHPAQHTLTPPGAPIPQRGSSSSNNRSRSGD